MRKQQLFLLVLFVVDVLAAPWIIYSLMNYEDHYNPSDPAPLTVNVILAFSAYGVLVLLNGIAGVALLYHFCKRWLHRVTGNFL